MRPSRRSSSIDRQVSATPSELLITSQVLLLVGVSSWGFGGLLSWGSGVIAGLTLLAIPVLLARRQEGGVIRKRAFIPVALWVGFVILALLNPSHVIGELGWQPLANWKPWLPTTPDTARTEAAALPWLAALLLGGVLTACPPSRRHTRLIWSAIALNGFVLAVVGAGFQFMGATRLLGFMDGPASYFFATFFYKNHWAAYGALCAGAGLALALDAAPCALRGDPRARGSMLLYGSMALLTLVTLPLPGSRSGVLLASCLLLGVFATVVRLLIRDAKKTGRSPWKPLAVMTVFGLSIVGYGALAYAKTAETDFARTKLQIESAKKPEDIETRILLSRDTWHMAKERPWFGWGPGSFEIVFPIFQGDYLRDADGRITGHFEHAHDDWLEQLAETGSAGLLIILAPLVLTGVSGWRRGGLASRWALAACGLLLFYSFIDLPFHNPAVLVLLTVLWTTAGRLGESRKSGV